MITLQKWGNSQGIRLPKFLLDELGWSENDELSISKDDDKIIIKKQKGSLIYQLPFCFRKGNSLHICLFTFFV